MEWRERGLWADRRTELRRPAGCAVASAAALGIIRGTASHDSAPRPPARRNSAPFLLTRGGAAPEQPVTVRRAAEEKRAPRSPAAAGIAALEPCACPDAARPRSAPCLSGGAFGLPPEPSVGAFPRAHLLVCHRRPQAQRLWGPLPDGGGMPPALPSRPTGPCPSASAPCGRPCRSSSPARTAKTPRPFFLCIRGRPDRRLRPGCRT